jgi:hypothetical protein
MFALKEHVANVCFKCFKDMLQAFYIDAAKVDRDIVKVDRDVAHVAIAKYTCCKIMFQVLQVFQTYVANISSGCFKNKSWCCTCCNDYIYTYVSSVSYVLDVCCKCFILMSQKLIWCCLYCYGHTRMFQAHVSSVSDVCCKCFIWMFKSISRESTCCCC